MAADSFEDLDSLINGAVARVNRTKAEARHAVVRKTSEPAARSTQQLFLDPDNWERKRGIALVHEETQTLLGNFSEYVHRTVAGCRRLVREAAPISVSATEYVDGNWWLGEDRKPEPARPWHTQHETVLHLHLDKLGVHSPGCPVRVFLAYGSMERVELLVDTQFAQEEGRGPELLFLAAGVNVLQVMSRDCKVRLMQGIGDANLPD